VKPGSLRTRVLGAAVLVFLTGAGCSLIVSGDVPEFQCDGTSLSACPSGQQCDLSSHKCTSLDGSIDPPEASDDDVVTVDVRDSGSDGDATVSPADLGAKCRLDVECKSKLCASGTILTTAITSTTGPICTSPCCTSAECPASFVCFNGGTGGGYCVPKTLAQRTPPTSGGLLGGATCVANTDCRSGLCTGTPKTCLDTCCALTDCSGSSTCRLKSVSAPGPTHDVWVCAPPEPTATKNGGDACSDQGQSCRSDVCIPVGSGLCRPSCSDTDSCRTLTPFVNGHCVYGTSGTDFFKFCQATTFTARLAAGQPCGMDSACQSDFCDAELKKCAEVCAKDSDCLGNEACRPSAVNTPYLRCVPRP
jgi:hypothetical protein